MKGVTPEGETYRKDCATDFAQIEFWSALRQENWWEENNRDFGDVRKYWEYFHGFAQIECDLVKMDLQCRDFSFLEGQECDI